MPSLLEWILSIFCNKTYISISIKYCAGIITKQSTSNYWCSTSPQRNIQKWRFVWKFYWKCVCAVQTCAGVNKSPIGLWNFLSWNVAQKIKRCKFERLIFSSTTPFTQPKFWTITTCRSSVFLFDQISIFLLLISFYKQYRHNFKLLVC